MGGGVGQTRKVALLERAGMLLNVCASDAVGWRLASSYDGGSIHLCVGGSIEVKVFCEADVTAASTLGGVRTGKGSGWTGTTRI